MKILGIDPGTATTGFAVIEKTPTGLVVLDYGVITTPPRLSLPERLIELSADLQEILETYQPDLAAVESLFFFKNQTTVFPVAQARGVIIYTIAREKIPIVELTPLQVKQSITGYGQADKKQVQKMVKQIFALEKIPQPDDAADALAIAFAAS